MTKVPDFNSKKTSMLKLRIEDNDYEILQGNQYVDIDFAWNYLKELSWWKDAVVERFITAVLNSRCYSVFKVESTEQGIKRTPVAFLRAVTDYATFAYLDDLVVEPESRKLGIGQTLIKSALIDPDLQTLKRWLLVASPKLHNFFKSNNFDSLHTSDLFMEIYNGDAYSNDNINLVKAQKNGKHKS